MAQAIADVEFPVGMRKVRDRLYRYEEGAWTPVDVDALRDCVVPYLGINVTISQVNNVMQAANWIAQQAASIQPSPDHICFRNGTYDVHGGRLVAHSPAHKLRNRIKFDYDPQAECPAFLHFLNQTFEGDSDKAAKIMLLQEWFGLCLTASTRYQVMLILLGEGANGKSVIAALLRRILGAENTMAAELNRFKLPHVRATLEGTQLNIAADLSKHSLGADGVLKAIIAGDPIEVSPKHVPSYTIEPYAKMMVCSNYMPPTTDTSEGYARRLRILRFNRIVPEAERDSRLQDRLAEEIPGIIAWAIRGLHRLNEQGHLTGPVSSAILLQAHLDEIDPIRQFAAECLRPSEDRTGYKAKDLFRAYAAWSKDHGFKGIGNAITMGRSLVGMGFMSRKSSTTIYMVKPSEEGKVYFGHQVVAFLPPNGNDARVDAGTLQAPAQGTAQG